MENQKEIHYEIIAAIDHLEELYRCIDNATALASGSHYLQDILQVASRNLGQTKMKLLVASDMTEAIE